MERRQTSSRPAKLNRLEFRAGKAAVATADHHRIALLMRQVADLAGHLIARATASAGTSNACFSTHVYRGSQTSTLLAPAPCRRVRDKSTHSGAMDPSAREFRADS